MKSRLAIVRLADLRTSTINVPSAWVEWLLQAVGDRFIVPVTLQWHGKSAYLAWNGGKALSRDDGEMELDVESGRALGLSDGDEVRLSIITASEVEQAPIIERLHVSPWSEDDWEILSLNAHDVEERMLRQVHVVYDAQTVVVWVSSTLFVRLVITDFEPQKSPSQKWGLLDFHAELIVAPRARKANASATSKPRRSGFQKPFVIRCVKHKSLERALGVGLVNPFTLYKHLGYEWDGEAFLAEIKGLVLSRMVRGAAEKPCVRVTGGYWLYIHPDEKVRSGDVWVSDDVGTLIAADPVRMTWIRPTDVGKSNPEIKLTISDAVSANGKSSRISTVIANQKSAFRNLAELTFAVRNPPYCPWACNHHIQIGPHVIDATSADVQNVNGTCKADLNPVRPVTVGKDSSVAIQSPKVSDLCWPYGTDEKHPVGLQKLLHALVGLCRDAISHSSSLPGIIVTGQRGSGKTMLLSQLQQKLQDDVVIQCEHVCCEEYTYLTLPTINKKISLVFQRANFLAPSLVMLDDFHKLVAPVKENTDGQREAAISALLMSLIESSSRQGVMILATTTHRRDLHHTVANGQIFQTELSMPEYNAVDKEELLRGFIGRVSEVVIRQDVDIGKAIRDCESFAPGDLQIVANKAIREALCSDDASPDGAITTPEHLAKAIKNTIPQAMKGLTLAKPMKTTFSQIGGLHAAKKVLQETLEWPARFPKLFATSKLRPRSGILIYGFPGCGKTMLAAAAASSGSKSVITVKGPELLNKFIGASEAAVRDVFARARLAKPCTLLFDEFEALAPKRDNDKTGVEDRVVNQLLTEMDGVEGSGGVTVIATSSRPDLIDPAVLRPGRLDKWVFVGLPREEERSEILTIAMDGMNDHSTKDPPEEDNFVWQILVEKTAGFSGADLQALVYNAFLMSLKGKKDAKPESGVTKIEQPRLVPAFSKTKKGKGKATFTANGKDSQLVPTDSPGKEDTNAPFLPTAMLDALESMNPSIHPKEVKRLFYIYEAFAGERMLDSDQVGKKLTQL